jgi:hypothetical protein
MGMPITIFYCWQSDRDQDICHYLIRDAAQDAIGRLKTDADTRVEEAPPFGDMILDHDTKGVPGIPRIADVIQRKIAACDVFIADVTHIKEYVTGDGRKKYAQNGNVLIELGHALAQKSPERILLVMNTAFGSFDGLPFDLHLHRKPIPYNLPDSADKDAVKVARKALTDKLMEALRLMLVEIGSAAAEESRRIAVAEERSLRERANEKWERFISSMRGGFRGLPNDESYIAVSIVPLHPPATRLPLAAEGGKRKPDVRPFGGGSYYQDVYGRSVVSHNGRKARGDQPAEPPTTVTELSDDGAIFAANTLFIGTIAPNDIRAVSFEQEERQLFIHVTDYVALLRQLGVTGRLEVRVSLFGVRDVQLLPARRFDWSTRDFRTLSDDVIHMDTVTLEGSVDGAAIAAIAESLRPPFEIVWRDAGLPHDPCFTTDGKYKSARD